MEILKLADGLSERGGSLLVKKQAVHPRLDNISATTLRVSNDGAAGGESFDGGDAKGLKAGEKISFCMLEIGGELIGWGPGEEFDIWRTSGKLQEMLMFGTVADD